jgi:hypothetical protein
MLCVLLFPFKVVCHSREWLRGAWFLRSKTLTPLQHPGLVAYWSTVLRVQLYHALLASRLYYLAEDVGRYHSMPVDNRQYH